MKKKRKKIRQRVRQEQEERRLLKKGKRGVLNVIFGRTMLILVALGAQFVLLGLLFSSLRQLIPYYYGFMLLLDGAVILHLVNKPSEASVKITWILLVVLVPALGVALYLFVETDAGHRRVKRRVAELARETAVFMPDAPTVTEGMAEAAPELPGLCRYTWRFGGFPAYEHTDVRYLDSGESTMDAMLRDLESARDYIFMEFFIIDEGYMWGRVLKILEDKVRQGVEVRVMYDGTCALFRLPYRYPEMMRGLGIQCKMFAPLKPMMSTHYNNRDHRKILVVDGRVAYTGGVNLADEYINRKQLFGHWKDFSIRLEGEAVRSFTLMFLRMWNVEGTGENFARYMDALPAPVPDAPGWALPFGDSPFDDERVGEMIYMDVLNRAERYVHIVTPYLILDDELKDALSFAAKRGVEVVLLLPHIPDKKYAFALARTHYRELLEAGVRILEYTPGFVHVKTFVSDDCKAVAGTINLDYRSLYLHFECAVYLRNMPAVADMERDFQQTAAKCQEIRLEDLKREKLSYRVAGWLLKVFAPLM